MPKSPVAVAPDSRMPMDTSRTPPVRGFCGTLAFQLRLLIRKNFAIQQRNFVSTVAQFTLPLWMLLIVLAFQVDDRYNYNGFNKNTFERMDNPTEYVRPLPTCADFSHFNGLCKHPLAIVYDTPNSDTVSSDLVGKVVDRLLKDNSQIEVAQVAYFNTTEDINSFLTDNPLSIIAALHFPTIFSLNGPSVTVQYNHTGYCVFGGKHCTVQWRDVQLPVQTAVEEAILGVEANKKFDLKVGFARFPNPRVFSDYGRDISVFIAPTLILLATVFNFVVQLNQLVQEKELKLKLLLRISGVRDTAMWLSWWIFFIGIATVLSIEWYIVGAWFGNEAIGKADPGVIILAFFTFYLALSSWAAAFSTYFSTNIHGYGFGFFLAVIMWLFQGVISSLLYTSSVPSAVRTLISLLLPPFVWAKGFAAINNAAERGGFKWADLSDDGVQCPRYCSLLCPCEYSVEVGVEPKVILPLGECIQWFVIQFVFWGVLAVYFDQTGGIFGYSLGGSGSYGRPQPWYFIFQRSYWFGSTSAAVSDTATDVVDDEAAMDTDVLGEMRRVLDGGADNDAIRVVNLGKTFKGRGCCGVPFTAVYRVNVGITHETLFCLLGHNGAGKTTTFNMLSGLFEPTKGDAFVFGKSVKKQLRAVQSFMGICPQHDVLWPELSGVQHLNLFSGLAGVPPTEASRRVESFLQAVDLVEFGKKACRKYSGGMRRRLSVACALIADPKVVYLDEPTTGMDPVNRRGVWDVIEKAKKGRVVVLTTHAMEEADTLGDRISIMSRGRLHCIGTSLHLKNKYGTGYTIDIKAPREKRNELLERVLPLLPNAVKVGRTEISGTLQLDEVDKMAPLCEVIEGPAAGGGGSEGSADGEIDMTVSMCTLETVFISIAESAGDPEAIALRQAGLSGSSAPVRVVTPSATSSATLPTATPLGPVGVQSVAQGGAAEGGAGTTEMQPLPSLPIPSAGTDEEGVRTIVIPRAEGQKLGLDLTDKKGAVLVAKVHDGYAAAACGQIVKDDIVLAVGHTSTVGMKRDAVYGLVGALPPGSAVSLTLDCSKRLGIKKKRGGGGGARAPSAPPSPPTSPPAHLGMPPSALPQFWPAWGGEAGASAATGHSDDEASSSPPASPPSSELDRAPADRLAVIRRAAGQKLGLDMEDKEGAVVILKVHAGYAAASCPELLPGAVVTAVGGESLTPTAGLKKDDVFKLIKAIPDGMPVRLSVRGGQQLGEGQPAPALAQAGAASSTAAPLMPGSSTHGASMYVEELDTHGVLESTLDFTVTKFRTQFRAVARKNLTFQKRQPVLNICCCCVMPLLFLAVYILLMLLPGIIIGGNTITCGSKTTSASSVDDTVINNNPEAIQLLISQLQLENQIGRCPAEGELTQLAQFNDFVFRDGCSNARSAKMSPGELSQYKKIRANFGCNESFYEQIYPKYEFARNAKGDAELCITNPNVTYSYSGLELTSELGCYQAFGIWRSQCTDIPGNCPNNETNEEDPGALTQVGRIKAVGEAFGCSADAADRLDDYKSTTVPISGLGSITVPANVTKEHVRQCLSERYMCVTPACEGVPIFLAQDPLQPNYPLCDNTTSGKATQLSAFYAANGAGAGAKAIGCLTEAADFCSKDVAFAACPKLVDALRPTEFLFSTAETMPDEERERLGELKHSTAHLAGCSDCFNSLLATTPVEAVGALANFRLRQSMSTANAQMSLPTVRCATSSHPAGQCKATRAQLDDKLWEVWYGANDTSRDYSSRDSDRNEGRYQGAFHFDRFDMSNGRFDYTILYNGTLRPSYDMTDEPVVPALAHRLASMLYMNSHHPSELYLYSMDFPEAPNTYMLDLTLVLTWVFPAVLGFLQVVITFQMVAEKATNMRELMVMAGLKRGPYWIISWGYGYLLYLGEVMLFLIVAYAFEFRAIANHDFAFVLILLLLWSTQITSYAMFMSTVFGNKWAALVGNFFLLIIIQVLLGWQFADRAVGYRTSSSGAQFAVNLLPVFSLAHASQLMHDAGIGTFQQLSGVRLGFENIGWDEAHPIGAIMVSMLIGAILWMALAIYCDLTLTVSIDGTPQPGVKRHPLFFLHLSTYRRDPEKDTAAEDAAKPAESHEAPEVLAERARVLNATGGVRALGLAKRYPGAKRAAVVNVQFGINESECFGLLGSNGAGKSTTIHILCGLHQPTSGTVLCGEQNLDVRTDITTIQSAMGVCSQDNLLWDDLTGPEHLLFFSRLRRVEPKAIKHHIDYWLRRVNLARAADKRKYSRSYSGGMKRRLGVANAFIGNPKLVYLDEPSTGLDPESRQQLWRAVLAAKPNKSIILTTHALEEAEALCDRVGIMTFGLMRTLGTPTELRIRFDQGYKFMIACEVGASTSEDAAVEDAADRFISQLIPPARQVDRINGVLTYLVPKGSVAMSVIFKTMESNKAQYKIKDWGLSHTSLEEVFLQIVAANSLNHGGVRDAAPIKGTSGAEVAYAAA